MGFEHLVTVFDTIFRQINILVYYFSIKTAFLMTWAVLRGVQSFSIIFNQWIAPRYLICNWLSRRRRVCKFRPQNCNVEHAKYVLMHNQHSAVELHQFLRDRLLTFAAHIETGFVTTFAVETSFRAANNRKRTDVLTAHKREFRPILVQSWSSLAFARCDRNQNGGFVPW